MNDSSDRTPWIEFRNHFEANASRPLPVVDGDDLAQLLHQTPARAALAAVLARFQLGEAGEGRIAQDIDRTNLPAIDDDYRRSLKLFVKEEGRHARILGQMVDVLGGQRLHAGASNRLFVRARRLMGVRFKIAVLLVAEVVGNELYLQLASVAGPGRLSRALQEISVDEGVHLRFHAAFLGQEPGGAARVLLRLGFWAVAAGAVAVVLGESRRDLSRLGLSANTTIARLWQGLRRADRAAFIEPFTPFTARGLAPTAVGGLS